MSDTFEGSEQISPAEFHMAPGVSDWRVTSDGPQAVFTAKSLAQAAGLVVPTVPLNSAFPA